MYHILDRSDERLGEHICQTQDVDPERGGPTLSGFVLHMQQNRSSFPQESRGALCVLVTLLMATSILPAIKGHTLVPIFSLGVMALLVWALDHHQKSAPFSERLELDDGEVRYADSTGRMFALPSYWVRFEAEQRNPSDLRLMLRNRDQHFEVGTSLSFDEKRTLAPVIAGAFATARGA